MITGYNTDVEYNGVVYHVQTEDKGLQSPIILSLVYIGGAILASKRAPYDDLIASGFDQQVLAERLQRQHKLICAAVLAGRIEDLKRMSERDGPAAAEPGQVVEDQAEEGKPPPPPLPLEAPSPPPAASAETASSEPPAAVTVETESLSVRLLDEPELSGGRSVVLKVLVDRKAHYVRTPAGHVKVTVRTLGTAFAPNKMQTSTDSNGLAVVSLTLPDFETGRAALLIRAEDDKGHSAELRRIVVSSHG